MTENDHPSRECQQEIKTRKNEELPLSAEVLERVSRIIDERQRQWLAEQQAQDELLRALSVEPAELHREEEIMHRIYSKLGIQSEVEELNRLKHERHRRIREAENRLSESQDAPTEPQGDR